MSIFKKKSENYFVNDHVQMWIEDKVLFIVFAKGLYITNETVTKCADIRLHVTKGEDYLMLVDVRPIAGMDKNATEFCLSGYGTRGITAAAYIVKNETQELICNSFVNVNRPIFPSKLFRDEEKALSWLKKYENLKY